MQIGSSLHTKEAEPGSATGFIFGYEWESPLGESRHLFANGIAEIKLLRGQDGTHTSVGIVNKLFIHHHFNCNVHLHGNVCQRDTQQRRMNQLVCEVSRH